MTAPAWALLAAAVLLAPARRRTAGAPAPGHRRGARRRARSGRPRPLVPVALFAVVVACLVVGGVERGPIAAVLAGPPAWAVLRRLQARAAIPPPDPGLPLALDLVAAVLRAGRPLADALALAGPAARADTAAGLAQVAGLLRFGAAPEQAWDAAARAGPLVPVAAVSVRSAASGLRIAAAYERLAADLRAEQQARGAVRAARAGTTALAPLAACFLPSFVCLGVVPVVVGIAGTALAGVAP